MRKKHILEAQLALLFLALFLQSCSRPEPQPVLSSWSEQLAAAERAIRGTGDEFMIVDAAVSPVRSKQGSPGEPIELGIYLMFENPKASQLAGEKEPHYEARMVQYNDHRLATTLKTDKFRRENPDEVIPDGARLVRVGPQDVLKATLAEGEAFMGAPVDAGNMIFRLSRPSEVPRELNVPTAWRLSYLRKDGDLTFWMDVQTGAVLKREIHEAGAKPK